VRSISAAPIVTTPIPLSQRELQAVIDGTLEHYAGRAATFWEGTRDHDVSQNITALLAAIEAAAPLRILDVGCGPGRDLKTFSMLGHEAIGVEGTPAFAEMARVHSGCKVWQQDFMHMELPPAYFDGVYANAALFHVPAQELPRVLGQLHATLKPRGALFSSNPHGNDEEGWNRGRYGIYHRLESWRRYMTDAGFVELKHYYRPDGLPRDQQPWLATVWRNDANELPSTP
jgi:SAM-dependent methyltransferase